MSNELFSPAAIAELLTAPGSQPLIPTDEQTRVIEAPAQGSILVVAGAGSGKTETIASRVLWLVANGYVRPREILGLTFTRKAAGELAERVRTRLLSFVNRAAHAALSPSQREQIHYLATAMQEELDLPEVSTYNAFASATVQEFGQGAGVGGELIDEAMAWGIAREVVSTSSDPRIPGLRRSLNRLTQQVLQFERAIHDHLSDFETARRLLRERERLAGLPYNEATITKGTNTNKIYSGIHKVVADTQETLVIADLAEQYSLRKQAYGVMEFSDQVAHAFTSLRTFPDAVELMRKRHRVILLDEFQDTSVAQTKLLAHLFAGQHVMGVGDPHQSIYAWRGASAESLTGFHAAFTADKSALTLTLSTSWRNAQRVLAVANRAALPLTASSSVPVPTLTARQGAPVGEVSVKICETPEDEYQQIATWLLEKRSQFQQQHQGELPTAAVIVRKRKYMLQLSQTLTQAGVPNRIIGVGGLLDTPEVRDIVCLLRCVNDPLADNDLVRILAGPRFAFGTADLVALRNTARWLSKRDHGHRLLDKEQLATDNILDRADQPRSLIEALDVITRLPFKHQATKHFSAEGAQRAVEAGNMLRRLRLLRDGSLHDLIYMASRELNVDIELEAHEKFDEHDSAQALENIHTLLEEVQGFLRTSPRQGLTAVLEWLETIEQDDDLPAYVPPPTPGTVQIITAHSSKGLEWDFVAVSHQMNNEFPTQSRNSLGEFSAGVLPDGCRGDQASRPKLSLLEAATQKEFLEMMSSYKQQHVDHHEGEELRLLYVAYTRARQELLLTGAFWGKGQRARTVSHTLQALQGILEGPYRVAADSVSEDTLPALVPPFNEESIHEEHPLGDAGHTLQWPLDPLGARRPLVHAAANAVRNASPLKHTDEVLELLLQEAQQKQSPSNSAFRFTRLNASSFHEVVKDPDHARNMMMRPLPSRPYRNTRVGNLFHEWVERRTTTPMGSEVSLDLSLQVESQLSHKDEKQLQALIDTFEKSRWANRKPIMVEELITVPFADIRVQCKLDAVYEQAGQYEIVDWKTGRMPATEEERQERFLQLDLYRVALSQFLNVPVTSITATLFYVNENTELNSSAETTLTDLEQLWTKIQPPEDDEPGA